MNIRQSHLSSPQKGITILELLISVAIIALLSYLSIVVFSSYRDSQVLQSSALQIGSLLNEARSVTLSSKEASQYGVHFEGGRVVLFKGTVFTEPSVYNKEITFNPAITMSVIDLNGGGSDVIFTRLSGETSEYGTTTLTLNSDITRKKDIVIYQSGVIIVQ